MNVLYVIGNGLDISLGMKTDYQSFYDFYKSQDDHDPDIIQLKNSIEEGRYKSWADLEAGLGRYTKDIEEETVFLKCLNDLKISLTKYLQEQYNQKRYTTNSRFINDFLSPDQYLDDKIKESFNLFVSQYTTQGRVFNLRIVTLNYTNTIEDVYNKEGVKVPVLLHLHGSLDEGIVMGVSDTRQISKKEFQDNRDIVEEFVKPSYNDACLNNNNSLLERWINESSLFVLFGTSLGETDRKWWRLIGSQLQKQSQNKLLIYFAFDKDKDIQLHPNHRLRWTEDYQQMLLTTFEIPEDKWEFVLPRLCVGINKPIFKLGRKANSTIMAG